MFDSDLQRIERVLDVSYPRRLDILREIEADMWSQYEALCAAGLSATDARTAVLREMGLDEANLASLSSIHHSVARRMLLRLPQPAREPAEWLAAGIPLLTVLYISFTEVPMIDFFHQGGYAMWLILLVGGAGLLLQLRRAFSWFVAGDHSPRALSRNNATPLHLAAATVTLTMMGTALNFYTVLNRFADHQFGVETVVVGFVESLSTAIVGGFLATLIILSQIALQVGLRARHIETQAATG